MNNKDGIKILKDYINPQQRRPPLIEEIKGFSWIIIKYINIKFE